MKIIILGAGQVGGSLAAELASEANDITVVDVDATRLRVLGDRLDIRTIQGRGSLPTVLRQAGADDADMLIAVTSSDETNMVACQVAYSMFRTPTKIARIRESAYLTRNGLLGNDHLPVDVVISPEQAVTNYIKRLIQHPGALQVLDFAEGKVQLVAVRAYHGGPLVGQELRYLRQHMPSVDTRVAAIFRRDRPITPKGDTIIEAEDGGNPGIHAGHVLAQIAQLLTHQGAAVIGTHRHQLYLALGKVQHLQGTAILDQALDVVGNCLLGADDHVHRQVIVAQQAVPGEVGRFAYAGNLGGGTEHGIGHLAGNHVGLIAAGHRDQHVRIVCAGLAQNGRQGTTALDG